MRAPRLSANRHSWAFAALTLVFLGPMSLHAQGPIGRLSLAAVPDARKVDGAPALNAYLSEGIRIRPEGDDLEEERVVVAGVIATAEGDIVSRCVSEPTRLSPGTLREFEGSCGRASLVSTESLPEGPIELGAPQVLRGEEPGCPALTRSCEPDDLVSGAALGGVAARMARELGQPVLVIGVVPADTGRASQILMDLVAYPCGLPM